MNTKAFLLVLLGVLPLGILNAAPLKIFILAGQSNMEGHAKISSFDHIGMDPKTKPMLEAMQSLEKKPRVYEDVFVSYLTGPLGSEPGKGKLTAGFGSRKVATEPGEKIGPEFTFGIYLHKLLQEPILIVKTAWGGKSLNTDFRSPGSGPYEFNEKQIEQLTKREKDVAEEKKKRAEASGVYYRAMMEHIRNVLKDPASYHPAYDPKEGYELSGFVWFQGWNDMVDSGSYPERSKPGGYALYTTLLAQFIRDVRKDLNAPELPFVIGVMGAGGPTKDYGPKQQRYKSTHEGFRSAMAAPAKMPEFQDNVIAVRTENYWDPELDEVSAKRAIVNAHEKELKKGNLSKPEIAAEMEKFRAKTLSARDLKLLEGITNADYHYKGSAKILGQIGKAFAEANHKLLTK